MLGKFKAGDFIKIAGEMHRFPASNENTVKHQFHFPTPLCSLHCDVPLSSDLTWTESLSHPRWPIYEISITSGFYLTVSLTSEDNYATCMNEGWRREELIIYYVKIVRFTVGIINKSLIIPTEDWRPTSFGPNEQQK
jgi:hypothetical protein